MSADFRFYQVVSAIYATRNPIRTFFELKNAILILRFMREGALFQDWDPDIRPHRTHTKSTTFSGVTLFPYFYLPHEWKVSRAGVEPGTFGLTFQFSKNIKLPDYFGWRNSLMYILAYRHVGRVRYSWISLALWIEVKIITSFKIRKIPKIVFWLSSFDRCNAISRSILLEKEKFRNCH